MSRLRRITLAVALLVLCITILLGASVQIVIADGPSMEPTIYPGDTAVFLPLPPRSGDVVLIKVDGKLFIKRVIATGGQRVSVDPETGTVTVDGTALEDGRAAYRDSSGRSGEAWPGGYAGAEATVPEGCFFVLGDNRAHSQDSRDIAIGFVPRSNIIGRLQFLVRSR